MAKSGARIRVKKPGAANVRQLGWKISETVNVEDLTPVDTVAVLWKILEPP